jgi:hypothetical protein
MGWNYRVMIYKNSLNQLFYNIFEVQYDENGVPVSYHPDPVELESDSRTDMSAVVELISKAFKKPTLKMWDFPYVYDEDI